jgi:hypothetical protein
MQTLSIATIHDHWSDEATSDHAMVALRLWARHFAKRHPVVLEILEWGFAATAALVLTTASLIANA